MELHTWFPSVIGKEEHPEWLQPMTDLFDKIFNTPNKNINSNFYYNGETTYGVRNLSQEAEFQPFINFVLERGKHFLELQGYDSNKVPWRPYLFGNSFKRGSTHPKHLHSQCTLSGIYYLKTPPGSSKIVFTPNQPFKDFFDYMFMVKDPSNWYSLQSVEYTPTPGTMLIWPSWLYHEVPPNQSDEPRTSFIFNL